MRASANRRVLVPCSVCDKVMHAPLVLAVRHEPVMCGRCKRRGGAPKGARLCSGCNTPGHYRPKCPCLCARTKPAVNYGCPVHGKARIGASAA